MYSKCSHFYRTFYKIFLTKELVIDEKGISERNIQGFISTY